MTHELLLLWDEFIEHQLNHKHKHHPFTNDEQTRLIIREETKLNDFMEWLKSEETQNTKRRLKQNLIIRRPNCSICRKK